MNVEKLRKWSLAAIPGGLCMAVGVTAAVVDELEYRGVANDTIPDALAMGVTIFGSILLMVAFTSIRRLYPDSGTVGYWITMAGLVLLLWPIWPLIFLGPMLVGIGATVCGGSILARGSLRSFGSWLHVFSIPVAIASGLSFHAAGFDGGIGTVVFMAMVIAGFMILGFDAGAPNAGRPRQEVTA